MAEELLDCPNVVAPFQKIRRKGMPKGVAGGAFGWSGFSDRTSDRFLNDGFMGMMPPLLACRVRHHGLDFIASHHNGQALGLASASSCDGSGAISARPRRAGPGTAPPTHFDRRCRRPVQAYLNEGIDIPEPDQGAVDYSGRFLIRLPKYLHRQLAESAQANGVSLNQYACTLLAMHYQEDRLSGILTGVYDELRSLNKMIGNLQYRMEPSKAVFRTYKWEYSADGYKAAA